MTEQTAYRGRGGLIDVVNELKRQIDSRSDFVMDTREFEFHLVEEKEGDELRLALFPRGIIAQEFIDSTGFPVLDQAIQQIASKAPIPGGGANRIGGIPVKFFRNALKSHPARMLSFLNGVIHDTPKRRLIRVLDGQVRAFLSDQYRIIDNLTIATQALEVVRKLDGRVLEASITDSHMRLKFISTNIWEEIDRGREGGARGWYRSGSQASPQYQANVSGVNIQEEPPMNGGENTVWPVGIISNSETGHGGFTFQGGIVQAICYNLATVEEIVRKVHLGSRLDAGAYEYDTIEAEAKAIFLKMRDNMNEFFTPENFKRIVEKVRKTQDEKIASPSMAVRLLVGGSETLVESDLDALVDHFVTQAGDHSIYNLGQAVARYAQNFDSPQRADDLEVLAGQILCGEKNDLLTGVF